jgi:ribosome maturation factor RimP
MVYIPKGSMVRRTPWRAARSKWGAVAPLFLLPPGEAPEPAMTNDPIAELVERQVEAMGFELVELERAGSKQRPILRIFLDRPDSVPGTPGVSLEDCTAVSRALEPELDAREDLSDKYVLEVSSPGVDRPLTRPRDYTRFAGQTVALRGKAALAGRAKRLQGTLLGLRENRAALRLDGGEEIEVPLGEIDRANLVFRWERKGKP